MMNSYFLVLEILLYAFAFYILIYKKEMGIIYLPSLFFTFTVITPSLPIGAFYALVALLIFSIINKRSNLLSQNVAAVLLVFYFLLLLTAADPGIKYSLVFSVLLFFISIPLINLIYRHHSYDEIMAELTKASLIILVVFVSNAVFSTITKYNPQSMYGINSGVLYGNLGYTDFNVIGIALFIVLLNLLKKYNLVVLAIYIVAFAFVMLTLRRSAMLVSGLGVLFAFLSVMTQRKIGQTLLYLLVAAIIGSVVYFQSGFVDTFNERYELRRLDEREFEEEKRFAEYDMLYKDMFLLHKYSPWFGYGLFNSAGHYGEGQFEDRTLHGDLTSLAHSSGLIGVLLYLIMVASAFSMAFKASKTKAQKLVVFYCLVAFVVYTITGRYSQADAMLLLFLVTSLSLARPQEEALPIENVEFEIGERVLQ